MKRTVSVAVCNQKGGVGKSTLTVLLAGYLHYVRNYDVAVIDCDTHQHSIHRMRERDMQAVEKSDYYKRAIIAQYERIGKKAYTIVDSSPQNACEDVDKTVSMSPELDIVMIDLPGSVDAAGVLSTILNSDYVLTPIVADRIVMQSSLTFALSVMDYMKGKDGIPLKGFRFVWNKVDKRVSPEIFESYVKIMRHLNLSVLETIIPETKRFDRELSVYGGKSFFRCTLLPPPAKLLKGSNIDMLAEELTAILKL